ncbi:acyltransferase family protein [Mesorhizobium sp. BAC0120]|uniref:acyltransferase family protein n=1 Tax=Mesorhizobium sp. BAC0120 TaxID=3090670 RepID=UPI00298CEBB6|nr:acyltransferase family protein [Mesorhizobium sp. BAC0120]MDW6025818.1 acyltransferase family protein [Mesorhizobium sp. BAC0120]
MKYRPDIDGLRAAAVLSVLLYHLGFRGFTGGFVGVDVFFVISGYLITGIIKADLEGGVFDFANFYARRARRLLPALFTTIGLSSVIAIVLFTPEHLQAYAGSARDAALGVSNIRFWRESDYFDISARLKPLLHTWSLSVEWQFYALWPAFIVLGFVLWRRGLPWLILAGGFLSLLANLAFEDGDVAGLGHTFLGPYIADGRATIFYNMPFRVFEFACGALLLWLRPLRNQIAQEVILLVGLVGIAYAVMYFRANMLFDPLNSLLPCTGAALVIFGGQARLGGWLLRNPISAYIGRISYSIYLVHWPLIVFTEYFQFAPLTRAQATVLAGLSIALAAAMYSAVEVPFRTGPASFARYVALALCVSVAAMLTVPASRVAASTFDMRTKHTSGQRLEDMTTKVSRLARGSIGCDEPCEFGTSGRPNVLVVGDSHVDQYTKALDMLAGSRVHFLLAYSPSCFFGASMTSVSPVSDKLTRRCDRARATLEEWQKTKTYSNIIVGQLWSGYWYSLHRDGIAVKFENPDAFYDAILQDIGNRYAGFTGRIVFLGRAPDTNLACYDRPNYLELPCPAPNLDEFPVFQRAFERFAASTKLDVSLVNPVDTICPNEHCRLADKDGHVLYTDVNHLSVYGAEEIVPQILRAMIAKPVGSNQ